MRRIDLHPTNDDSDERRLHASSVLMHGEGPDGELVVASSGDITFPAVWQAGERLYDVEVWRDGELVATVPPRSDDVDEAFDEHERRRAG